MTLALRGSRLIVIAAALELLTAIAMPALPLLHGLNDDPCSPSVADHDGTARLIDGREELATSLHCSICPWWQSAGRFSGPSLPAALTPLADFGLVAKTAIIGPTLLAFSNRPARAPPTA